MKERESKNFIRNNFLRIESELEKEIVLELMKSDDLIVRYKSVGLIFVFRTKLERILICNEFFKREKNQTVEAECYFEMFHRDDFDDYEEMIKIGREAMKNESNPDWIFSLGYHLARIEGKDGLGLKTMRELKEKGVLDDVQLNTLEFAEHLTTDKMMFDELLIKNDSMEQVIESKEKNDNQLLELKTGIDELRDIVQKDRRLQGL